MSYKYIPPQKIKDIKPQILIGIGHPKDERHLNSSSSSSLLHLNSKTLQRNSLNKSSQSFLYKAELPVPLKHKKHKENLDSTQIESRNRLLEQQLREQMLANSKLNHQVKELSVALRVLDQNTKEQVKQQENIINQLRSTINSLITQSGSKCVQCRQKNEMIVEDSDEDRSFEDSKTIYLDLETEGKDKQSILRC